MIRVVIVDDEALIRSGFTLILNAAPDIEVVAAVSGGRAVAEIGRSRPDVVLLDIRMPDVDGLTVLRQVRAAPHPPVVAILTTFDTDEYVSAALRLGAVGFLLKDTDPEHLAHQVRTLAGDGTVLSARVTRTVVDGYLANGERPATYPEVSRLTGRERDVLELLAEGISNAEIAARMHLSAGTVKDHVSALLTKLRVHNRVQAALVAQRAGLLGPGGRA
ncbi:response regulator transcription factor [Natronosporangium hydrolyticum]|uniref:Response regulator transcription factor n=1 Tax=Natronosporangium hydrolyticum TaxID=2811111 RepID=A0A895YHW7_9ACTN|nr:response regulator transcription factor [Natronosporangium hydrolyticum]QSB15625.1 response regulator transcription factor [Natronosporangium hydrolyticum]